MVDFPQRLVDGYRAFLSERLPTEQDRYRELAERGQIAGGHGDRLLRLRASRRK